MKQHQQQQRRASSKDNNHDDEDIYGDSVDDSLLVSRSAYQDSRNDSLHYDDKHNASYRTLPHRRDLLSDQNQKHVQHEASRRREVDRNLDELESSSYVGSSSRDKTIYRYDDYMEQDRSDTFLATDDKVSQRTTPDSSYWHKKHCGMGEDEVLSAESESAHALGRRKNDWSERMNPLHDHLLTSPDHGKRIWSSISASNCTPKDSSAVVESEVVLPLLDKERESSV